MTLNNNDTIIGILLMIKDEAKSIAVTLNSTKNYFKHIIVYDTGSTDNTIHIVKECCKKNNQTLHLKQGVFKGFPESRNDSLEFAETVTVDKLILMDAGDEFRTNYKPKEFLTIISKFPYKCGIVKKQWLMCNGNGNNLEEHSDIRFICNHKGLRYDIDYPVHEMINYGSSDGGSDTLHVATIQDIFCLYQDRVKYGGSTEKRYIKDIDLLLKAKPNKRNLFFLAQSYMSINDFKNGYKYNLLCINADTVGGGGGVCVEVSMGDGIDNTTSYIRAGYCAMMCHYSEDKIIDNLLMSIKINKDKSIEPPIDPYIYILKYYMDNNKPEKGLPYIDDLFKLDIKNQECIKNLNPYFYVYTRWNLISVICLMCNQKLDKGFQALNKIIHYGKANDLQNMKMYKTLMN
jgi:glycosyltransferase involved in cell wall biosynthesis